MAIKASANITLFDMVDIDSVTNYYLLQSSTANPPAKPTTDNPGGNWSTTEPTYTEGSTNTLYTVMKTKFSDGTFEYTPVSKSSSYEAAKSAYNKAVAAQTVANGAKKEQYHTCSSGSGTNGYFQFANIEIKNSYANQPITLTFRQRGRAATSVELRFKNLNGLDPDLDIFKKSGQGEVYIIKTDTSKWSLYAKKSESYDSMSITDFNAGSYASKFKWDWIDTFAATLPSGYRQAVDPSDLVVGTQTAKTGAWTGVANFDVLVNGQEIYYWLPYAGDGNATLNLTLPDGTTTGAINCYYSGASRLTTHYAAGNVIHLTYRVNANVNGTNYTGWWADANYDSNTYDRIKYNQSFKAKVAINKYNFIGAWEDGLYLPIVAGAEIDITKPILYFNNSSNIAADATNSNGYLSYPAVSLRNTISGWTGTLYASVYLKGELNGNLFTLDETNPYTCTVPTSDDGNTYVLLGQCIGNNYSVALIPEHPLYRFFDGEFKALSQIAADYRAELNESISNAQSNAIAAAAQNTSNQLNDYNETIAATYSTKTDVVTDINKSYALVQQNFVTKATYDGMDDRVDSAEATLAELRSAITQFAGYYLTDEIPDDWATNYTDYYTKNSNNVYIHVTGSTAPTWAANTYYKAGAYMEISSGNSNLKLRLENDIIRLMSGTTTLTKWRTDLFQVYQTITRVLNIGPPNAGHFSFIFNDDGSLSIRKVT